MRATWWGIDEAGCKLSQRILHCVSINGVLKYPVFPSTPGATFHAASEDNLFAPPKHPPPNYD